MRYSYAWDVTPQEVYDGFNAGDQRGWQARYVLMELNAPLRDALSGDDEVVSFLADEKRGVIVFVRGTFHMEENRSDPAEVHGPLYGRVIRYAVTMVQMDTLTSRFHPASIAGLVVGAMGAFVFAAALRHWLGERGRFRGEASA
jgi:hypothetical protein